MIVSWVDENGVEHSTAINPVVNLKKGADAYENPVSKDRVNIVNSNGEARFSVSCPDPDRIERAINELHPTPSSHGGAQ